MSPSPTPQRRIDRVSTSPHVVVVDGFVDPDEIAHVLDVAADRPGLTARGIRWKHDTTGFSFEMPIEADPVLVGVQRRIREASGLVDRLGSTFRFRDYDVGESHPPHLDVYEIRGFALAATAMVHLADTEAGGETRFPRAVPSPLLVAPRAGRLVLWRNVLSDGRPDPASLHEGLPIVRGSKMTITQFLYVDPEQLSRLV